MKKVFLILLIGSFSQIFSQGLNRKWIEVIQLPDQKVYVDSSTIKQVEGQISVLSITYFTHPKMIAALNSEASSVKSQILFNMASQKYTTVGTLYYDKSLKILGESSIPGHSLSGEAFAMPIDTSMAMIAVYTYCLNYINSGERVIENKDFSKRGDKIKSFIDNKVKIDTSKKAEFTEQQNVSQEFPEKNILDKEKSKITSQKSAVPDSSIKVVNKPVKKVDALKTLLDKKKNQEQGGVEVSPRSAVFKDGNKYSFQVSSWKNKAKAESEMVRLKSQGHNAFLVEAYIPERGGTWYRVRIGPFNSIEESEAYKKKLK